MFAEQIKKLRKGKGLTQTQFAAAFHVSNGTIAMWETGKRQPDMDTLDRLSDFFGVSLDYLLGKESAQDGPPASTGGVWIPVLGRVAAGTPLEAVQEILDYEEITMNMAGDGDHFALQIKGDSMEPKISDGDVVIVRKQSDADNGDTAVVLVNGEDATVKKIKKGPDGIMLIPTNPSFEPIFYSNAQIETLPVRIIGKAVELRAKF